MRETSNVCWTSAELLALHKKSVARGAHNDKLDFYSIKKQLEDKGLQNKTPILQNGDVPVII